VGQPDEKSTDRESLKLCSANCRFDSSSVEKTPGEAQLQRMIREPTGNRWPTPLWREKSIKKYIIIVLIQLGSLDHPLQPP